MISARHLVDLPKPVPRALAAGDDITASRPVGIDLAQGFVARREIWDYVIGLLTARPTNAG